MNHHLVSYRSPIRREFEIVSVGRRFPARSSPDEQTLDAAICLRHATESNRADAAPPDEQHGPAATPQYHYRQVLEALPAAIYTTDVHGRITFYNRAAVELSGREPQLGIDQWCVTWRLLHPDGTPLPHEKCPMAVA